MPYVDYTYKAQYDENYSMSNFSVINTKNGNYYWVIFLGGDKGYGEINTSIKNGKSAIVVKDSFGNAFVPFLLSHYENIYVIDPRHYWGSITDLAMEKNVDDLIFVNTIFNATNKTFADYVEECR